MSPRATASLLLALFTLPPFAAAGESASSIAAPLVNLHTLNLELDWRARRRSRPDANVESVDARYLEQGLQALTWPRNTDLRARLLTPELKRTPVVGWIAAHLYRSRLEKGWCLEVDPGEGEYLVFYRVPL